MYSMKTKSKSNTTIFIELSESMLEESLDVDRTIDKSYSLLNQFNSQKRSASNENFELITENKRQRNNNRFYQQPSLPKSNESQLNKIISKRSVSIQNDSENHFDWLKDFMYRSMNTIRDNVVQACLDIISNQSLIELNSINKYKKQMNENTHRTDPIESESSLTSTKTNPLKFSLGLLQNRSDNDNEIHIHKELRIHHRARTNAYPIYSNILRTPVRNNQVPWSYEWPTYKPATFTAPDIYINPGADPDLLNASSRIELRFNAIDGAVDRRSAYRPYNINKDNGLPLNPIGRTGLQGRGILLRWGPNIYHYILICRWKRDLHGRIEIHPSNRKPMLEILLEIQNDDYEINDFILTGGLHMIGSRFPPQLQDRLQRFLIQAGSLLNNQKTISLSLVKLNSLFEQMPISWKGAYFDDARNTDNAWIELSIEYILDSDNQLTSCIPDLNDEQLYSLNKPRFIWKIAESTLCMGPRTHYRLIKNLAHKLDAYF